MKILFFAPHAAVWVHAFPEALVAEALRQNGHEIVYASCGRAFDRYCVAMSAHGVGYDAPAQTRRAVCEQCTRNEKLIRDEFRFDGPALRNVLTAADLEQIEKEIATVDQESFLTFERDGIKLGRVALYQMMVRRKILDSTFTPEQWQEYLVELRYTLYAWRAAQRLIDRHRPDRIVVYNGLYSVNRAACLVAQARGIPAYFLHAGGNLSNRLQTLMIGRDNTFSFYPGLLKRWGTFSQVPCSPRMLANVTDHYATLFAARSIFVYSKQRSAAGFDARAFFGIRPDQKILVATLGSYDEEVAAEMAGARIHARPPLFRTQIDWMKALLAYAGGRRDIFLIVRVHPREFSNSRERVTSQHSLLLREALSDVPGNVAVNWPDDNISLYDLADQADVFLNSWSSTGKEMALLGIPVVIYSRELPFYPAELNYFGDTLETYFSAVERALADGWSAATVRQSYRWGAYEFIRSTIDIADSYSHRENERRSVARRVADFISRKFHADFRQRRDLRHRSAGMKSAAQIADLIVSGADTPVDRLSPETVERATSAEETAALRRELLRLGQALFPSRDLQAKSRLYARFSDPSAFA